MTCYFQILIDCLPAVIDAEAAWTTKPRLFEALRCLEAGNGIRVYEMEADGGDKLTGRDCTEDIAIEMANLTVLSAWEPECQPFNVFCPFVYTAAERYCEDILMGLEAEDRDWTDSHGNRKSMQQMVA